MKNLKNLSLLITILLCGIEVFSQTSIYYFEYDASGNRTKRYMVITPVSAAPPPQADTTIVVDLPPETLDIQDLASEDNTIDSTTQDVVADKQLSFFSKVFPNPTNGVVNIQGEGNGTLIVSSISGQVLHNSTIQNGSEVIDISSNEPGQYFLRIIWENGNTETWKITKL